MSYVESLKCMGCGKTFSPPGKCVTTVIVAAIFLQVHLSVREDEATTRQR